MDLKQALSLTILSSVDFLILKILNLLTLQETPQFFYFLIAFDLTVINHFAYLHLQLSCFCQAQLDIIMLH